MNGSDYAQLVKQSPYSAHRALFDEYYNYVYTIVCGRLANAARREDIEECVSDVFADVFFQLDKNTEYGGELRPLVATVAKRRAIDKFRRVSSKKFRLLSLEDDEDAPLLKADFNLEESIEKDELGRILLDEIEALGEPDSTIIIQRFYFNRTSAQIAASLSMKSAAVRMRCSRALKKLKASLLQKGIDL